MRVLSLHSTGSDQDVSPHVSLLDDSGAPHPALSCLASISPAHPLSPQAEVRSCCCEPLLRLRLSPPALRTRSRLKQTAFKSLEPVSPASADGSSMDSDDEDAAAEEPTLLGTTTKGLGVKLPAMRHSLELASRAALVLLVLLWGAAFAPSAVKFVFDSSIRGGERGYSKSRGHLEVPFGLDVSLALLSPTPRASLLLPNPLPPSGSAPPVSAPALSPCFVLPPPLSPTPLLPLPRPHHHGSSPLASSSPYFLLLHRPPTSSSSSLCFPPYSYLPTTAASVTDGGHVGSVALQDLARELEEVLSFPEGLPMAKVLNVPEGSGSSSSSSGGIGCPGEGPPPPPCPEEKHCDTALLERCQEELEALQEGMQRLRESSDALSGYGGDGRDPPFQRGCCCRD